MTDHIPTPHPGEILLEDFLKGLGVSLDHLSSAIDIPVGQIAELTLGRQSITAPVAHKLGRYFGTEAEFWLRLQLSHDVRESLTEELQAALERIEPHPRVAEIANTPIPVESADDAVRRDTHARNQPA